MDTPDSSANFSSLNLSPEMLDNIAALSFKEMTPIQAQSLPAILEGKDLLAQAKTGSGKTAAFAIGLLSKIDTKNYQVQSLVLCPTRELAEQVSTEIRRFARAIPNTKLVTLCGGKPMLPQLASLEHPPHIVVGTPGRVLKHLDKDSLKLNALNTLVLDEADRMLDMGFYDEIMRVINKTPKQKQSLLFSATYPEQIKKISHKIQNNPIDVHVESVHDDNDIKQLFYEVDAGQRSQTLVTLIKHYRPESSIVFCNTKQQCQELLDVLSKQDFHVCSLHGDLEQRERDQVIVQFSNKSSSILVATDVAARGLDIKELSAVINFELSPDPEVHIHRIGRTGRAGSQGLALSLFLPSEKFRLEKIEAFTNQPVVIEKTSNLKTNQHEKFYPPMVTFGINGGRKDKVRAGDILGALTANKTISGKQIGKIDIFDKYAYVAVEQAVANKALETLSNGKIKGRKFKIKRIH